MDNDRLTTLIALYFDEGLDGESKRELEQALLASAEARELFWETADLNAMLRQLGQESWGPAVLGAEADQDVSQGRELPLPSDAAVRLVASERDDASGSVYLRRISRWIVAAVVLLAVGLAWWGGSVAVDRTRGGGTGEHSVSGTTPLPTDSLAGASSATNGGEPSGRIAVPGVKAEWVAMVRRVIDVTWTRGSRPLQVGEAMFAREISLNDGLLELQTSRGALLTLQGPAELQIVDAMNVRCRSGRLRVDVPPSAIGFVVDTPHIDVVDRGTSFSVDVDSTNETSIHVLDGKVDLVERTKKRLVREVVEGQAVGIAESGVRDIVGGSTSMPTALQVRDRANFADKRQERLWLRRREAVLRDPSCVVYYDFQDQSEQSLTLQNKASSGGPESDGTIVGCEWVQGRWPGKRALDFKNSFDRILFQAPGDSDAVTCLASVRLDAVNVRSLPLLMPSTSGSDGFGWRFCSLDGVGSLNRLQFGWQDRGEWLSTRCSFAKPCFSPEQLRTWVQLAVVWDGRSGECRQYLNGQLVSFESVAVKASQVTPTGKKTMFGLGNSAFNPFDPASSLGRFAGRIDEWAMLNRALSESEILAMHDLTRLNWIGGSESDDWGVAENWPADTLPGTGEAVYIDRSGRNAAMYSAGQSASLNEIRIGSAEGARGELRVTGGTLTAMKYSNAHSRVGVAGGRGRMSQTGGQVILNSLQLGLDPGSLGAYELRAGTLTLARGVPRGVGSLDVGAKSGVGDFRILGGALATRVGVSLGRVGGTGRFTVVGAGPESIAIGSFGSGNGFWTQYPGGTLEARIDPSGLTPIVIHNTGNDPISPDRREVKFVAGSRLHAEFVGPPRSGQWDVMRWDGELNDQGLTWSEATDRDVWSFEFVDTNSSGTPDTLRVIAELPSP